MNAQSWIDCFEANRTGWSEPDWAAGCRISDEEKRRRLAASLATFQLGETGGGTRLMRYVTKSSAIDDSERESHLRAMRLFIAEENYHAELLAKSVTFLGGKLRRHHWSNSLFRSVRSTLGLEFNVQVLLIAELIAEAYYGLLYQQVPDKVIREVCGKIVRDEVGHIAFHREFFRHQHRGRLPWATGMWSLQFQVLFSLAERTVWLDHGRCLRALGISRDRFARRARGCCRRFLEGVTRGRAVGSGPVSASEIEFAGHSIGS